MSASAEDLRRAASEDVVRLMLQFCKESGLPRTMQVMQEESRVTLNAVDSVESLQRDIVRGRWDAVVQAVAHVSLPLDVQQELYSQIVLELAEAAEVKLAKEIMQSASPLLLMQTELPDRYLKLEAIIGRKVFEPRLAYPNSTKEKARGALAATVGQHLSTAAPGRLLALLEQALKWQKHTSLLPAGSQINLFKGEGEADAKTSWEDFPTRIAKTIKFGPQSHAECATFSPDGQYCVTGSVDGFVEIWDYQTGLLRKDLAYQEQGNLLLHESAISAAAFSASSDLLATGDAKGELRIWKVSTGQCARKYASAHSNVISAIAWSKDSLQLLTASADMTARVHGVKSGKTLREYRGHTSFVNSAFFTGDFKRVVTASEDGSVKVWEAKLAEPLRSFVPLQLPDSSAPAIGILSALLAPPLPVSIGGGHDDLIFICLKAGNIQLTNLSGQVFKCFSIPHSESGCAFVAMTVSPRGEWLYGAGEDRQLHCFSVETGELAHSLEITKNVVYGIIHHPKRSIVASWSSDNILALCHS